MPSFLIDPFFYNWLILGSLLLIIEVASFTLLFFWLALAAFIMAAISYLLPQLSISQHLLIFSVTALACVLIWHQLFKKKQDQLGDKRMNNRAQRYIGRSATLIEATQHGHGKIRLDDSLWRVKTKADLAAGTVVEITDADGVILHVRPK